MVKTKILMISSNVYIGISGITLTFFPEEISQYFNTGVNITSILFLQILGVLYLGFAMLNWMTKNNLIGGIYNKPLLIGNLAHFFMSSFALIKIVGKYFGTEFLIILSLTLIRFTVFKSISLGVAIPKGTRSLKRCFFYT